MILSSLFGSKKVEAPKDHNIPTNNFREAGKVQAEVLDVAVHQLKTPLVGMKWSLKMLIDGEIGPLNNEQRVLLIQTYNTNDQIISTVDGLLYADRIESGSFKFSFFDANIADILIRKVGDMMPNAENKKVTIEVKADRENLPNVSVDSEKIMVVFQNLIENSLRYTKEGGKITITVSDKGDNVQIAVEDNGIGIPEDQKDTIFNKFFRAKNAFLVDPNGSGLGLYIAKGIVEKHGGQIWFESTEGKGTKMIFTIPVRR